MEFGVGIHGEPGIDRRRFSSLDQTVDEMVDTLLENGAYSRTLRQWDNVKGAWQEVKQSKTALQNGDRVIALVNNPAPPRFPNCTAFTTALPSAAKRPAL